MAPTGQPASWDTISAEHDKLITPLAMEFAEELLDRVSIGPGTTFLDVAASQFGINLAPDIEVAFGELARVTRPGGRVLVASFGPPQKVEFIGFFMGAMQATIPNFAPPDLTDAPPTRLADPDRFRSVLTGAGLTDVNVITTNWPMAIRSGRHLWDVVLRSNPMGRALTASLTDQQRAEVQGVLDGLLPNARAQTDACCSARLTSPSPRSEAPHPCVGDVVDHASVTVHPAPVLS